jgi:uncharacterized protein (TIGR03086 family)
MDPVDSVARVLDEAHTIIASTTDADLAKPTPCATWNVGELIEHMVGVVTNFGKAFGGSQLTPPAAPDGAGVTSAGLAATYQQAVDVLLAEARAPGALDKTLKLPFGELPGLRAIRIALADQLIHSWDLSKAIGRPFTMDEPLAAATLDGMRQLMAGNPNARGDGRAFGAEVPCSADAPAQDRLLAFSGRQP